MNVLRKLKRLVTGERIDLKTGEIVDHELRLAEMPSSVPMAPPIDFKREPTIFELVKQKMLEHDVRKLQEELGAESPEEAEDFDINDPEYELPNSPYEFERHEEELRESFNKLAAFQALMEAKYPERYADQIKARTAPSPEGGAGGGPPPRKARSAPLPRLRRSLLRRSRPATPCQTPNRNALSRCALR